MLQARASDEPRPVIAKLRALYQAAIAPARLLVVTTIIGLVLRILGSMVLTRLLSPDVFGLATLITSTFVIIGLLSDLGISAYVIRHKTPEDPHVLNTVWTIQLLRGVAMFAVALALSYPVSFLLGQPSLTGPMMVASLALLIDGVASLSMLLAIRNNQSNRLALLDVALQIAQIALTTVAAYYLRNIWAIVIGIIGMSILRVLSTYFVIGNLRHKFNYDDAQRRDLWSFSRFILASSIITLCLTQVDKFVMSRLMSLSELGLYALATSLALTPQSFVGTYAARILYPIYATTWHNDPSQLRETFYASRRRMSWLYAFAVGGLIGGALLVVRILFDPRYEEAAIYLSLLAIPVAMAINTRAIHEVLIAVGQVSYTLHANLARLIWIVGAGAVAIYYYGAWGFVLVLAPSEIPPYLYGLWQLHKRGLLDIKEEILFHLFIVAGALVGWAVSLLPIVAHL